MMTVIPTLVLVAFDAAAALKEADVVTVKQSSDMLLLGLFATIGTVLTALISGVVAVLIAKINRKQDLAAEQARLDGLKADLTAAQVAKAANAVEQVKVDLKETTGLTNMKLGQLEALAVALQDIILEMRAVSRDTHVLVNSNFGVQLKMYADVCWQLYEVVKTPEAKVRAGEATRVYQEHVVKQAKADEAKAKGGS